MANLNGSNSPNHIIGRAGADRIRGLGGDDTLEGAGGNDTVYGDGGNDFLDGGSGADRLFGGAGADTLVWHASDVKVDGGDGTDTLLVTGDTSLDLLAVANTKITGIEVIDLAGTNTLTLSAADVRALSGTTDILRVDGEAGDAVEAGGGWTRIANIVGESGQTYARYTLDGATLQVDLDVNRSGITVAELSVDAIDGSTGTWFNGGAEGDSAGHSVAIAGDVNGDGYADLLIGAFGADLHGDDSGAAYVVYGRAGGFSAGLDLSSIQPDRGFAISGEAAGDELGFGVSDAGDVNGDGYADLLIGAFGADPNADTAGAAYVVFGKASGFGASVELSALDGDNGFQLSGVVEDDRAARVSAAGDVNGDGYGDLLIGADWADPHAFNCGAAYVVFGAAGGFASDLDLSDLDGVNGFKLSGEAHRDCAGYSVGAAGDVNGDGYDDVLVGARGADPHGSYSGSSYLVFGGAGGFASNLDLSALNGTNGYQISGEGALHQSGHSLSGAGDVNGDGIADYVVGAWGADDHGLDTGAAYVVFGTTGGLASNFDLSALNGTNGFQITGEASDDFAGFSAVSGAGDVNGDGYDDLLVGAFGSDENGADAGAAYVVYGAAGGFGAKLELSALDGANGFQVSGGSAADYAGRSVSGGGDVNGDGFSDLVVGAPSTDFAGTASGTGYVVFGGDFNGAVDFLGGAGANRFSGTTAAELFVGGGGNDFMMGGGGADVFRGGIGNDTVRLNRAGLADIDGGSGNDTLALNGGIDLDLTTIANSRISGIETINLGVGAGASDLTLSVSDLLDLSDTRNTLTVKGAADDSVTVTDGIWTDAGVAGDYHVYALGAARLEIKTTLTDVTIALVD